MGAESFLFRQFTVHHDRCAMKVGTDGVLLGAWAPLPADGNVLDIGCGSGLISMMSAQRSEGCHVTGIDIDPPSVEQARENVEGSPFAGRIDILLQDVLSYETTLRFRAILCNPPFYTEDTLPPDLARQTARNASVLPFARLAQKASSLLTEDGFFSVVLPYVAMQDFVLCCMQNGLTLCRRMNVRTTERKQAKRVLLSFCKPKDCKVKDEEIVLMDGASRSEAYQRLTRDFYLW